MDDSREYPLRPIVGVGAVVQKGETVLLIRRGKPPLMGAWTLPGGAVELGETLQEAIRREVCEECSIDIAVGRVVDAVDILQHDDQGRVRFHYVVVDLAATFISGDLRAASDVQEARWVAPNDFGEYSLNEQTRRVVEEALGR
ncbi:MAG: NUDIX hydrolase [Chloroflexi bacterium]|nr:NUDIX hydrolase [Chloroflexota bacterium]